MYIVKPESIKNKQNALLLDARYDMMEPEVGPKLFKEGHIRGAKYVNLDLDMVGEHGEHGGRHPLTDLEIFAKKMQSIGASDEREIFIYDDGELAMAARLWYTFMLIGKETKIIEGGFDAMINAGFAKDDKDPDQINAGRLSINKRCDLFADIEDIKKAMDDPNAVIVDSRNSDRYNGLVEPLDKIAGHIPSAINIFWKDCFDGTNIKPEKELNLLFNELDNYKDVIFHCGSGITGAVNMLIYAGLGKHSRLYAGSYSDYITHKGLKLIVKDGEIITL